MEDLLKSTTFIQANGQTLSTGLRHPAEGAGKRCSECDHRAEYLKQTHDRTQSVCVCVCVWVGGWVCAWGVGVGVDADYKFVRIFKKCLFFVVCFSGRGVVCLFVFAFQVHFA